jgi:hypothetical protein
MLSRVERRTEAKLFHGPACDLTAEQPEDLLSQDLQGHLRHLALGWGEQRRCVLHQGKVPELLEYQTQCRPPLEDLRQQHFSGWTARSVRALRACFLRAASGFIEGYADDPVRTHFIIVTP